MKQPTDPNAPRVPASPSNWDTGNRPALTNAQIYQPAPKANTTSGPARRPAPTLQPVPPNYVDPYLFESGFFTDKQEHEQLMATAETRLQLRKDVEEAPKRKRSPRATK